MSNDIKSILERMAVLEGKITPVSVKHGLNPQQQCSKAKQILNIP